MSAAAGQSLYPVLAFFHPLELYKIFYIFNFGSTQCEADCRLYIFSTFSYGDKSESQKPRWRSVFDPADVQSTDLDFPEFRSVNSNRAFAVK